MSDILADLTSAVADAVTATGATGASVAVWDGTQTHAAVAGIRNSATGDPVSLDTLMHIGSITKIFNATLVMQMVDDGLVQLGDPVSRHLPDLRLKDPGALQAITVGMLLNHSSGIDGMILPDHGPDLERVEDAVQRMADLDQLHAPGGGPSYSNIAVVLAGYLAQRLRGASWYALVKERILRPLGLDHALVDLTEIPLFRVSVGDVTDPATGQLVRTTRPFLPMSFAPAGATMMMSAQDLLSFGRAHLNGGVGVNGVRILSEDSTRLMQRATADVVEPKILKWGLGWQILPGGLLGHGGGGPGVASQFYIHPATGKAVVILTNCDTGGGVAAKVVMPLLADWTEGAFPATPPEPATDLMPTDLSPYLGDYRNNSINVQIVAQAGGLAARMGAATRFYDNTSTELSPALPLTPLSDGAFSAGPQMIRFMSPDASGLSPGVGAGCLLLMRVR